MAGPGGFGGSPNLSAVGLDRVRAMIDGRPLLEQLMGGFHLPRLHHIFHCFLQRTLFVILRLPEKVLQVSHLLINETETSRVAFL